MESVEEKYRLESASQEVTIDELRTRIHELEEENGRNEPDKSEERIEALKADLKDKELAIEETKKSEFSSKDAINNLREHIKSLEARLVEVFYPRVHLIARLSPQKLYSKSSVQRKIRVLLLWQHYRYRSTKPGKHAKPLKQCSEPENRLPHREYPESRRRNVGSRGN
jgi:archaellum component FlaC